VIVAAPWIVAGLVTVGFVAVARNDARTWQVAVRHAIAITGLAVVGLGAVGVAAGHWTHLVTAAVSALFITSVQIVPYLLQRRRGTAAIGKADVRLAVPFGWTLGYFGLGFALVGFAVALVSGLGFAVVTRRQRVPFVPFLAIGLAAGLVWAAVIAVGSPA
jgi:prepilin signal peptidase PulO-like enzyme (type II secretory pathway)